MDAIIISNGAEGDFSEIIHRYLGPYKLAHFVRKHGYAVQVIDHAVRMTRDELREHLDRFIGPETRMIGVSATFMSQRKYPWPNGETQLIPHHVHEVIREIKDRRTDIHVILGGFNSNWLPDLGIFDSSARDYAEDVFLELLEHFKIGGDLPVGNRQDGRTRTFWTKPRRSRFDITKDDFRFSKQDCILPGETLPLEVSRGCMFSCKFCNHPLIGRKKFDYLRSMDLIRDEIMHNDSNWGTRNYIIICDTFNDTAIKMKAWYDMVKSLPFGIGYSSFLRADLLQAFPDVPIMLQDSGLIGTYHGIESLGARASMAVGKGWSGKHARNYIPQLYHDIWKAKIRQQVGFIAGLPGDTREDILSWADWFIDNDLYHIGMAPLWLAKNMLNPSGLSLELDKHGYTFPDDDNTAWQLPYWTRREAIRFVSDEFWPRLVSKGKGLTVSPWDVATLAGWGYDGDFFDKKHLKGLGRESCARMFGNDSAKYMARYRELLKNAC